jgi:ABC-type maltose transport system permease subunit
MYSRLNLIINELNSIAINKLGDADIVRKTISLLLQQKYGSIITILHNMEDLSQMTMTIVIGKIAAFEMSRKRVNKRSQLLQDHMLLHVMKRTRERKRLPLQAPQVKKRKKKKVMMMKKQSDASER